MRAVGLVLLSLMLSALVCCGKGSNQVHNNLNGGNSASPSEVSIPKKAWETIYFEPINERNAAAGMKSLKETQLPLDALEIRMWVGFDLSPLRGFLLRRTGEHWSATYFPPSDASAKLFKPPIALSPPRSGWQSLWGKLTGEDILTLPDAFDIGADNLYPDATGVVVEMKVNSSYRAYKYSGFDTSERVEAQKVTRICRILSEEFKIFLC